jgi:hypothetical protein
MIAWALLGLAAAFPVTIRVDAGRPQGELAPIWRFFGGDEPNYATMKDGRRLLAALRARAEAGLLPHPQPAEHRRRHARAQVGQHQRLHRGRAGSAGLRLERARPHLRHLPRARRAAVRPGRLHAEGPLDEARAVPARVAAGPCVRRHLHRMGLPAQGLLEVGGAGLPVGAPLHREVRRIRGRALVLGNLERGQHRLLAGHARGVPQAARPHGGGRAARAPTEPGWAAPTWPDPTRSSCGPSSTTA